MEKSVISQFFNGRSVFVTGSTGLMGKVLVWKLLYSCPGIKNIFVLIRSKRGKSALLRYQEIIKAPVRMLSIIHRCIMEYYLYYKIFQYFGDSCLIPLGKRINHCCLSCKSCAAMWVWTDSVSHRK